MSYLWPHFSCCTIRALKGVRGLTDEIGPCVAIVSKPHSPRSAKARRAGSLRQRSLAKESVRKLQPLRCRGALCLPRPLKKRMPAVIGRRDNRSSHRDPIATHPAYQACPHSKRPWIRAACVFQSRRAPGCSTVWPMLQSRGLSMWRSTPTACPGRGNPFWDPGCGSRFFHQPKRTSRNSQL